MQLSQLSSPDAEELFVRRATATRPDVGPRRRHRARRGRAARRTAPGGRAGGGPGADHDRGRGGDRPGGPVHRAAQPGSQHPGPSPHARGRDRLVVGPAHHRRAARPHVAVGVPGRLRPRHRRDGAGPGRDRPGRGAGRPVAAGGQRGGRHVALPGAGDHPGVRRHPAGRRRDARRCARGPAPVGVRPRSADRRPGGQPRTRWPASTSSCGSRTTSPTCCATGSPWTTASWWHGWWRCWAASGPSRATSPGSSPSATRQPRC